MSFESSNKKRTEPILFESKKKIEKKNEKMRSIKKEKEKFIKNFS